MTIFLVDDSKAVRDRFLSRLRDMANVDVAGVADGVPTAVAGILRVRPHLVVLDLQLRDGSGLDVLRGIRADHCYPLLYIVSNLADDTTRSVCIRAGVHRFFDKSTELDAFFDSVASLAAVC